jgi:MFS transporter, ACDE family, multidrug resistance protein
VGGRVRGRRLVHGLGLADPILPAIAENLHASPSQVELLFTSYFAFTGISMLVSSVVAGRIGAKRTLVAGLVLIIAFSAAAGASNSIGAIVGLRAGWGLGNALFIATALSVIVGSAAGGVAGAVVLYEAALGLGISLGPLVGGELGGISWRGPFFGVAVLMSIGLVAIVMFLERTPPPPKSERISIAEPLLALRHRATRGSGLTAIFYNFGLLHAACLHAVRAAPGHPRARVHVHGLGTIARDLRRFRSATARGDRGAARSDTVAEGLAEDRTRWRSA